MRKPTLIRISHTLFLWILVLTAAMRPAAAQGPVVDQVAATVESEIITLSDLEWLIEYRNFQAPPDPEGRRQFLLEILDQLIDQKLIAREAEQSPLILIEEREIDAYIQSYRNRFPSEAALSRALEEMQMTAQDLRELVRRQLAVNEFLEMRFAPFIIVLPDEIREYYETELVPELERNNQPVPSLEIVEEQIRQIITLERTNLELEQWIQSTRRKSEISILLFRDPPHAPNLPQPFLDEIRLQPVPLPEP